MRWRRTRKKASAHSWKSEDQSGAAGESLQRGADHRRAAPARGGSEDCRVNPAARPSQRSTGTQNPAVEDGDGAVDDGGPKAVSVSESKVSGSTPDSIFAFPDEYRRRARLKPAILEILPILLVLGLGA